MRGKVWDKSFQGFQSKRAMKAFVENQFFPQLHGFGKCLFYLNLWNISYGGEGTAGVPGKYPGKPILWPRRLTLSYLNSCTFSVSSCTRHLRTHCSSVFLLDFHSSSNFLLRWLNVSKVLSMLKQAAFVACLLLISAWELASLRRSSSNCPLDSVCMDSSSRLRRSSWCSCMRDFDTVTSPASKVCPSCSSTWLILWENYIKEKICTDVGTV